MWYCVHGVFIVERKGSGSTNTMHVLTTHPTHAPYLLIQVGSTHDGHPPECPVSDSKYQSDP